MTTKTALANFNFKRGYQSYDDVDRPISHHQRKTLEELIYSRVSNPEEIDRRLAELEGYNFSDASEALDDYLYAPWK